MNAFVLTVFGEASTQNSTLIQVLDRRQVLEVGNLVLEQRLAVKISSWKSEFGFIFTLEGVKFDVILRDVNIVIVIRPLLSDLMHEYLILFLEALAYLNQFLALLFPYLSKPNLRAALNELDLASHILQLEQGLAFDRSFLLNPLPVRVLLHLLVFNLAGQMCLREFIV